MAAPEKYGHISFVPPAGVRREAARGLAMRREHGRGGTAIGIARARDLSNGTELSPSTLRRMKAFFDRHAPDRKAKGFRAGEEGFPSNGKIADLLWGGRSGESWCNKVVRQMNAADERTSGLDAETATIDEEALAYRSAVMQGVERRYYGSFDKPDENSLKVEHRADPETGKRRTYIVGYAAKFGTDSLLLGDFIERLEPTAFDIVKKGKDKNGKPLSTRCLFNHDPNHLLGRFPTTMKMTVDKVGLRYECLLPESRQDIAEMIARGDLKGSSFSFVIDEDGGEKWTTENGQSIRLVKKIKSLLDCSPVTYPAYDDATVEIAKRSYAAYSKTTKTMKPPKSSTADEIEKTRKFLADRRAFCPTGPGGGQKNDCSSKDGGEPSATLEQQRLDVAGKAVSTQSGDGSPKTIEQERLEAAGLWDPRIDPFLDKPYDGGGHGGFIFDSMKEVEIPGTGGQRTQINVDDNDHIAQYVTLAARAAGKTPEQFAKDLRLGGTLKKFTPDDKVKLFGGSRHQYATKAKRSGGWGSKANDDAAKRIGSLLRGANINPERLADAVREYSKANGLDAKNEMYSGLRTYQQDPREFMQWARKRLDFYFANNRRSYEELVRFVNSRGFCATGPGGGIDNSCGASGSSKGGPAGATYAPSAAIPIAASAAGAAIGAVAGVPGAIIGGTVGLIAGAVGIDRQNKFVDSAFKSIGTTLDKLDKAAKALGMKMSVSSPDMGKSLLMESGDTVAVVSSGKSGVSFHYQPGADIGGKLDVPSVEKAAKAVGAKSVAVEAWRDDDVRVLESGGYRRVSGSPSGYSTSKGVYEKKLGRSKRSTDVDRKHEKLLEFFHARGFCPTGPGGGIDNTCSSSGSGGGPAKVGQSNPKYMEWKKGEDHKSKSKTDIAQDFIDAAREEQLSKGGKDGGKSDDGGGVQTWSKGENYPWTVAQTGDKDGYLQGLHPDGSKTERYPFKGGNTSDAMKQLADEIKRRGSKRADQVAAEMLQFLKGRRA